MSQPPHRLVGIELVRFACAVTVVAYHYHHFGYVGSSPDGTAPPLGFLGPVYIYGLLAVQVFWVLSGFIFFHNYAGKISGGRTSAGRFAVLRFSRLYPLHLLTLLGVAALQSAYRATHADAFVYPYNDLYHFGLQLGFASNWGFERGFSFNGPIWSVSVEVLVYAVFFACCRAMRMTVWRCALLAVLFQALLLTVPFGATIWRCAFYFFWGGLTQFAFARAAGLRRSHHAMFVAGLCGLGAALVAVLAIGRFGGKGTLAVFAGTPLAVLIALDVGQRLGRRAEALLVALGNLTYASYLLHFPIQLAFVLVADRMLGSRGVFDRPLALLVFLVTTFGLARLTYLYVEMPTQAWLRAKLLGAPTPARGDGPG